SAWNSLSAGAFACTGRIGWAWLSIARMDAIKVTRAESTGACAVPTLDRRIARHVAEIAERGMCFVLGAGPRDSPNLTPMSLGVRLQRLESLAGWLGRFPQQRANQGDTDFTDQPRFLGRFLARQRSMPTEAGRALCPRH